VADAAVAAPSPRISFAARFGASPAQVAALAFVALFLVAFLVLPIARVIFVAFTDRDGSLTLVNFQDFLSTGLLREAFWNSIYVAAMTVALASLIAVPLATILTRFRFRGAALVFVKVFDDLATPLLLNVTTMLAPQAYLKITSVGITDPMGYVISVIMVLCSLGAMALSAFALRGRDFATLQRGGGGLARRTLGRTGNTIATIFIVLVLLVVLSPHIGILLLSFATVWSFAVLPDGFTLAHYATVMRDSLPLISNTILYCGLAGLIDIVLGAMLAYIVLRTRLPGRKLVEQVAMSAVAMPGLVLGIGLLRTYYDVKLPFSGEPFATFWFMLVIAYAVRRLPYALSAATAALQQLHVSLEEAAENLGARKFTTLGRIVVPLMTGGLLAGFVTSFATAAVELSATLLLVTHAPDAPLSYGIYVSMQSAAGRGPGAALGVIAVVVVAIATYLAYRVAEHERGLKSRGVF
jgi:iron(III) transport system permease protein